ncbi:hypothetical protein CBR_g28532 [Chara braunii]|uniref:glutathione-specific gamma-glutamylcyclotransferase n=1 Tax=Chara braunii TaxID=69332 RepID=A0A388JW98_CHABU|nr:hypothetical protein CBR_g28532 [Chara braunii]|eukprot:GBG62055.1 hypothetical protein CBR_g28532 [Chara braunii]
MQNCNFTGGFLNVQSPEKPVARVLVYIASEDRTRNVYYLGPAPLHDIAKQIATAVGPSGPNYEYLFRLEEALQEIGVVDEEVVVLAELVRNLMASSRAAVRGDKTFNPLPVTLGCQPPHQSTPSHNDANGTPISYREANGFAFIEARATGHSLQIAAEIVAEIAAELPACAAVTPDGVLGASKAAVPS